MDCRTTSARKLKTRLGFKQYDVILTKERSMLTRIMSSFKGENMQTQFNVLGYNIDLNFIFMLSTLTISLKQKLMKMDTVISILTIK